MYAKIPGSRHREDIHRNQSHLLGLQDRIKHNYGVGKAFGLTCKDLDQRGVSDRTQVNRNS